MEVEDEFLNILQKEARSRGVADLDIVSLQLKQLLAFQKYRPHQVSHFAGVMTTQNLEPEEILFKQGDEGSDWYVVYRGSIDIQVDGQIVCSFNSGMGFGDVAIMENSPRTATVVGKERCILLKVSGPTFKTIEKELKEEQNAPIQEEGEGEGDETAEAQDASADQDQDDKNDDDVSLFNFPRRGSMDTLRDFKAVLDMRPEDRGPDDLYDLADEISRIKAFSHLSSSIIRELCTCITSQNVEPDTILFKQGDEGTCWYIIYKGKVDVIVNGVTVCTLGDGDGFGELALINDKPRSATVKAVEETQLIKVEKADYNRILKDIESNTIRLEEHGKEVIVLEKRVDPGTKSTGYMVMSATPERLVRQLEENNEADASYIQDFLLSFRVFMTTHRVFDILIDRMKPTADDGEGERAVQSRAARMKKISTIVKYWISNHAIDFFQDPALVDRALQVVEILEAEKLDVERLKILQAFQSKKIETKAPEVPAAAADSQAALQAQALASEEPGKITLRKKGSVRGLIKKGFRFSIRSSSKDDLGSLSQEDAPAPVAPITKELKKVYMNDDTYKTIEIEPFMTAQQVLEASLLKFNKPGEEPLSAASFELCENKSDGVVRVIEPEEISLVSKLSLNGKLFVRPKGSSETLTTDSEGSSGADTIFLELDTSELARIITLMDHQLFCKIDPLEFVNHIYKSKGQDTSNLNNFVNQFNKMNYWVITEICSQTNLQKRILIVKKFIKLAILFKALNNYNSLFAVLSGLSNVAISRMHSTWRKIPSKLMAEYDLLLKLMDPSRNMKVYRTHLLNATPPLVPFFPIVIKDLFFIHECNPSKTSSGLVNFDKLRLLTSIIRFIDAFRYVPYDPNVQATYDVKKRRSTLEMLNETHLEKAHEVHQIKEYISSLHVIDNMRLLSKLSREAESPLGRTKRSASIPRIILGL